MSMTRRITLTAMLLALVLVFQALRTLFPMMPPHLSFFIIGTLVNLTIFLSVYFVGFWFTAIIAILAPVVAFLQGHLAFPLLIPVIAVGNLLPPLVWSYLHTFRQWVSKFICVLIGSVFKFGFLFFTVPFVFRNFIVNEAMPINQQQAVLTVFAFNFGWPQLLTALGGGILAIVIGRSLEKVVFNNN